ncbi:tetratricopeptide repeat protein [Aureisphaera sp. CAU 1614]|uniref:Tetratricopeptide repeat protein n=1 Tax=Halomarinibacterium sedimenti TaxID=2857106 RepID=A0A9X1FM92_9FLAO|nr:tetratricopeptide repeat protein [Halomarinibacterium sedimenti]MBW2937228.1 tetratricopeptide repeat protein [Halomarinibacterium sedimenti]
MKRLHKITIFLLAVLLFAACSRKKNTFLSRNYHAVTAEYNAIYNGDVALAEGKEELALTYRDNFWEILPVERIELKEEFTKPGEQTNPKFNRAEEKAAKAIQKHSIYIDGKEYNPQIDEAYMLLGKARYFDERFVPAQDAFNFILNRYATSNNVNEARMWKAKTNIRMGNEEGALEELAELIEKEGLEVEDLADASAIMAQAYINLDTLEAALPLIKTASEYVRDNELKGRYTYIKGQIYNRLGEKDSANMAFQEVIELNRKSPRTYMLNSYMEIARNFDYEKGDKVAFLELLQDLEKNRENRPFLDLIYNQFGEYYRNTKNVDTAIIYYNKSIKKYLENDPLQALNYSTLAEISFDRALYRTAGKYYDSTLAFLPENSRPWRRMKKKLDNLADVIKYEDIATRNDSILRLAGMSEFQQMAYFSEYTKNLQEQIRQDSIAKIKEEQQIANKEFYKKNTSKNSEANEGGAFYFYNSSTVAYGREEFRKIWGTRKLQDNWRMSNNNNAITQEENNVIESAIDGATQSELLNPQTYIATIPTDEKVIDSLTKDRNFAYYQLGLIYKEKFREYGLATNRLEKLLGFGPEERLVLPSKYNLYKIYDLLGNKAEADKWKNDILNNHSTSRYAEILRNPNTQLETDESSPEFKYKALYAEFEASNYDYVIATCDEFLIIYNGNDIVPKLEMLKATALGRRDGFEAYKKAVNFVALNYPLAQEGKDAQEIYTKVLPKIAVNSFIEDKDATTWKIVYTFNASDLENAKKLEKKLNDAIVEYHYENNMSISLDYYNPSTYFVIIHGLNTRLGGRGFAEVLKENKKYKIKQPFFEIASANYKIIQIHKNLDSYLNTDKITEENSNPQK